MNDLQLIKKRIYEEKRIREVLEKLGCWHIRPDHDDARLYTAGRPNGRRERSVQVKNSESLGCAIRTRGIDGIDIYGLVSYIIYDCKTESEMSTNLPKAKRWICDQLGYHEILNQPYISEEDKEDPNDWLKKIKKNRKQEERQQLNNVIDDDVLNKYIMLPHKSWIDEGLSYDTQRQFQVGFDIDTERIVFPVHSRYGFLVGVKGRYVGDDPEMLSKRKYLYLHPCNKSIELYNMHRAFKYIIEQKEVIVFEGAKSCMLAWQYGIKNTVSIEGDRLTTYQAKMLKGLGITTKIVFAWDKGKDAKFIANQVSDFKGRLVYAIFDTKDYLEDKQSPLDKGVDIWNLLYEKHKYPIRLGG